MAEVQEGLLDRVSDAIRTGKIGQEVRRSAQWFHDKVRGLKGELRNKFSSTNAAKFYRESEKINPLIFRKRVSLGDLFCYYYKPKYRQVLPYYDMFPMIMLISADKDTFLGINFHYLAPKFRAILLDRVTAKVGGAIINWKKMRYWREAEDLSPKILKYKEKAYRDLKKSRDDFVKRYGDRADDVMHGTAMQMAKKKYGYS